MNIRRAGTGLRPRVRPPLLALVALAVMAVSLASPLAALAASTAALNKDLKGLPDDASPKEACAVLIKHGDVKPSQEKKCRQLVADGFEAAKDVSPSGTVTIASAAACTRGVFKGKIKGTQVGECSKNIAERAPDPDDDDDDGGGGFNPVGMAGDAFSGLVGGITGAVGGFAEDAIIGGFKAIIDLLFGGLQSAITVALIKWMTRIPNLSQGRVGELEASIAVGAGGLLAATMTISIVRFWGSGLTGDGAWAGAEGVARAAVAAVLIAVWPQIFSLAVRLSNALQSGIMGGPVERHLKDLFRDLDVVGIGVVGATAAISGGTIPIFLAIVISIVGIMMLLALVAMKIIITALTIVLFCAMPLAFVFWPIPEMASIARFCLRSLAVLLAIPVIWCIIFGSFAAIGADTFSFHNTGEDEGIFGTALNVAVVRPLVAIALLYLALVVPRRLLQMAPLTGGGGGGPMRTVVAGAGHSAGSRFGAQAGKAMSVTMGGSSVARDRLAAHGTGFEKGVAKRAQSLQGLGSAVAGAKGKVSLSKLRDRSSQASKGAGGAAPQDGAQANGAGQPNRLSKSKGQARPPMESENYGQGAPERSPDAMKLAGGDFNGPRAGMVTLAMREQSESRQQEMSAARSKSNSPVTDAQAREAAEHLHSSNKDLYEAGEKAAFHLGNSEEATAAYAEWSVTNNPHVSPKDKEAFGVLGFASDSQRVGAFDGFKSDMAALESASRNGYGQTGTSSGGASAKPAAKPKPSRTPQNQPSNTP